MATPFNFGPVVKRCLPFRTIKGSGKHQLNPLQNAELVAWAASENLAETTSFYDDDVALSWNPQTADLYKDPNSQLWKHLADVKARLDAAGLEVFSISCELAAYDCFTYGALTNAKAEIRELALKKIDRAIQIGRFFNAAVFVFDADAEGFDSPFTINWLDALKYLTEGLNHIEDVIVGQKFENYLGACLAPRKAVPFQYGFINNVGDALSLIHGQLRTPQFWGICPSTYQLEQAGWSAGPATIANLAACGGMVCLKLGAGTQKLADRPLPPLFGTANLKETVQTLWTLGKLGWEGVIELDSMMSPAEVKTSGDVIARKQFVANAATALTIALELVKRISDDELSELTPPEADLMTAALFCGIDVDAIIKKTVKGGKPIPQQTPASAAAAPVPATPDTAPAEEKDTPVAPLTAVQSSQEKQPQDNKNKHQRNNKNKHQRDNNKRQRDNQKNQETAPTSDIAEKPAPATTPEPVVEEKPAAPAPAAAVEEKPAAPAPAAAVEEKPAAPAPAAVVEEKPAVPVAAEKAATSAPKEKQVAESEATDTAVTTPEGEAAISAEQPPAENGESAKEPKKIKRVYRARTGIRKVTKKK